MCNSNWYCSKYIIHVFILRCTGKIVLEGSDKIQSLFSSVPISRGILTQNKELSIPFNLNMTIQLRMMWHNPDDRWYFLSVTKTILTSFMKKEETSWLLEICLRTLSIWTACQSIACYPNCFPLSHLSLNHLSLKLLAIQNNWPVIFQTCVMLGQLALPPMYSSVFFHSFWLMDCCSYKAQHYLLASQLAN